MSTPTRVYLDHAGTTPVREEVRAAIMDVYEHYYGNPSTIYQEGHDANHLMTKARQQVAKIIHADPGEIYFTSCGSESDNWAIKGTAFAQKAKGKHIITSKIEHHAILHSAQWLEKQGFEVTYLDVYHNGMIQPEMLEKAIREDTTLISIMMANNEVGTIQPIQELAAIAHQHGALFHTDAVQALGAIPIDAHALGIDMMSFSAHKLNGPKGCGALYIKQGVRIDNLMHGGAQEKGKRAGTENVPLIVGFGKACELAETELPEAEAKITQLRDLCIKQIAEKIPYSRLNGHSSQRLPNNVNFSFEFIEGESMLILLDHLGYACASGSACNSSSLQPSHVLLALGLPAEIAHGSLRVTLGKENTEAQITRFTDELADIVQRLRDMSPLWDDFKSGKIHSIVEELDTKQDA